MADASGRCANGERKASGERGAEARCTSNSAVGACEGPGGPHPSHSTAAAAAHRQGVVAAAVVGGCEGADEPHLQTNAREANADRGESARGPPSGNAEPLDSSEDMARRWQVWNSPQAMPRRLGAGPSVEGLEDFSEHGERPAAKEFARRRVGADSPTCSEAAVARHGDVATVPRRWEQPETGCSVSHVQGARDHECAEGEVQQGGADASEWAAVSAARAPAAAIVTGSTGTMSLDAIEGNDVDGLCNNGDARGQGGRRARRARVEDPGRPDAVKRPRRDGGADSARSSEGGQRRRGRRQDEELHSRDRHVWSPRVT